MLQFIIFSPFLAFIGQKCSEDKDAKRDVKLYKNGEKICATSGDDTDILTKDDSDGLDIFCVGLKRLPFIRVTVSLAIISRNVIVVKHLNALDLPIGLGINQGGRKDLYKHQILLRKSLICRYI